MEREPTSYIEKTPETQETLRDIDIRTEFTNSLQADNRILSDHPEYQALTRPEDTEQRTALVDRIVKSSEEYLDEPLAREGVERAVRHMQLNVLINEAVVSLLTENPITVEDFKNKVSTIARRSETQERIVQVYNDLLMQAQKDRKAMEAREKQPLNVVKILENFSGVNPNLQNAANAIRTLREDIKSGKAKPTSLAFPTLEDCLKAVHLPFVDVIITLRINDSFKTTEVDDRHDPRFGMDVVKIYELKAASKAEAEHYFTTVEGRHLVVIHDSNINWIRNPKKALTNLRHEIEHAINSEINPKLQEELGGINYENRSFQECLNREEAHMIDELGAFGKDSHFTMISSDSYLPKSLTRLRRRAEKDENARASIDEFEHKWREVIERLQDIEDLVGNDKDMGLLVYHATARVENVDILLDNLDIMIALLGDHYSE